MVDYEHFNYSALNDKTISRKSFTEEQLSAAGINAGQQGIVVVVMVAAVMVISLASILLSGNIVGIIGVIIMLAILSAAWVSVITQNKKKFRTLKFAIDNNLKYRVTGIRPPSEPIMFNIGNSRTQNDTLIFPDSSMLANYEYTVGSGKDKSIYTFSFMSSKLPRQVPHLFVNSKKNGVNPDIMDYKVVKLELEGDFNKYFDVLTPPGYQVDALEILTPDVMSVLLDLGENYDFELIGDELYVYQGAMTSKDLFYSEEKLRRFLSAVGKIMAQFARQAETYSDTRAGNVTSGTVAAEGAKFQRRSGPRWVIVAVLIIMFAIYFVMLSFNQ